MEVDGSDPCESTTDSTTQMSATSVQLYQQPYSVLTHHKDCRFKKEAPPEKARQLHKEHRSKATETLRSVIMLVHGSQCKNEACALPKCSQLKRVVTHARLCKKAPDCPVCRKYIIQSYCHARECQNPKCPVIFCLRIKKRMDKTVDEIENGNLTKIHLASE